MKTSAFAVALFLTATAAAQDEAVFRSGVALVHVDAEVTQAGRTLTGFEKADFRILDEGVARDIVSFSAGQEPLDVVLLFDISGSMRSQMQSVAGAAREALAELRDGDRVCVMVFNSKSRVVAPFTGDLKAVENTIATQVLAQKFGGGTLIQTAVDDAALLFRSEPRTNRRRAVLIVTDNRGQRTRRERTVLRNFWEADAVLSAIIVPFKPPAIGRILAAMPQNMLLDKAVSAGIVPIVDKTGGDTIAAEDPAVPFADMIRRIRSRYSFYYAMPEGKPGSTRTVKVELTPERLAERPGALVRARKGYLVPTGQRP